MHFVDQINNFKIGKRKCLDMANTIDEIDYVQITKVSMYQFQKCGGNILMNNTYPPFRKEISHNSDSTSSNTTQTLPLVIPCTTKHTRVTSE